MEVMKRKSSRVKGLLVLSVLKESALDKLPLTTESIEIVSEKTDSEILSQ